MRMTVRLVTLLTISLLTIAASPAVQRDIGVSEERATYLKEHCVKLVLRESNYFAEITEQPVLDWFDEALTSSERYLRVIYGRAKFQNGYGAWVPYTFECVFGYSSMELLLERGRDRFSEIFTAIKASHAEFGKTRSRLDEYKQYKISSKRFIEFHTKWVNALRRIYNADSAAVKRQTLGDD